MARRSASSRCAKSARRYAMRALPLIDAHYYARLLRRCQDDVAALTMPPRDARRATPRARGGAPFRRMKHYFQRRARRARRAMRAARAYACVESADAAPQRRHA